MNVLVVLFHIVSIGFFFNMVETKYCPIEIDGDMKYYICPRNEICCTFGCCISSSFHFYQLWYYWLMVILMFLLCSGGTWWYRYWLQEGHYPLAPSTSHRPNPRNRPPPTRVSYHAGRNTVVVQQIWKPQRNSSMGFPPPPPSYSSVQSSTASANQSTASGTANIPIQVAKLKSSPYYQLYGPPPSYDSVITETLAQQRHHDNHSTDTERQHISREGAAHQESQTQDTSSSTTTQPSLVIHQCESNTALPK